jgi:cytochrome c oxidase cbb3-type subunit IV
MDINDLRILVTLLGLCLFIALMAWQWRPARRAEHDAAAQLPFLDDLGGGPAAAPVTQPDARHE